MVNSASRRLAGLTVFAAIALGCALPQVASASSVVWQLNGKQVRTATGVTSKAAPTLLLNDSKGGLFGHEIGLECKVAGKASVGPGAAGEVSEWTPTECHTVHGSCPSPAVTALNLPWHTELVTVEGKTREALSSGGSGAPGFKSTCNGSLEDRCTGDTTAAVNDVSGGVDLIFDSKSEKLSCTRGGSGAGSIEEAELVESPSSGTLTAGEAPPEGWYVNGEPLTGKENVTSSGTFTFSNPGGGPLGGEVRISCSSATGKESVGPGVAGEVSSWTATECGTEAGTCTRPAVTALNLPWHTELVAAGAEKRDLIESGGSGAPQFEVTCEGGYRNVCAWAASTAMENAVEGVDAIYGREERSCSHGHDVTGGGGEHELISFPEGTLSVE